MPASCIACDMISPMLSNLLSASSLNAWCFPCFTINILKAFCVIDKQKINYVHLMESQQVGLVNEVVETTQVISVEVTDLCLPRLRLY